MSAADRLQRRISEVGRTVAVAEEMLRLGFITEEDFARAGYVVTELQELGAQLGLTVEQLRNAESELADLSDDTTLLKVIRAERIAAVKARREERKRNKELEAIKRASAWEETRRAAGQFLGRGVSDRLTYHGGNPKKLVQAGLPMVESFPELAKALGIPPEELTFLCYERGATTRSDHYQRFEIPKRSGGKRLISSPKPRMRKAQLWVQDNILAKLEPSEYCYAFRPETSIVDNATRHLNKAVIAKCDIKDFFPTITFARVRGYFEFLGYNPGIATVLALICTDAPRARVTVRGHKSIVAIGDRCLPQGACTSPALANLIASRLDNRLAGFLKSFGDDWTYTRYADDLTFSTSDTEANLGKLLAAVKRIVSDEKFEVKQAKTRIMRAPMRQSVTGLIVGHKVRLPKASIKKVRALFHNIETHGDEMVSERLGKNALQVAQGHWAYMHMVDPELAAKYLKKHPWLVGQ